MKSQDILILLKLISLHQSLKIPAIESPSQSLPMDWEGWSAAQDADDEPLADLKSPKYFTDGFTTRGLEASLGLSKSEISTSLSRSTDVGLAMKDRKTGFPKTNGTALIEFIRHGIKYVFPARSGPMVRGIPTAASAPILHGKLLSSGQYIHVWPDPEGKEMGQQINPLYKSVPYAVRNDAALYAMLALVDAIRIGKPREANLAGELLEQRIKA